MTSKNIIIIGEGGHARETAWLIQEINAHTPAAWNVIGFLTNNPDQAGQVMNNLPVVTLDMIKGRFSELYATIAIGEPKVRMRAQDDAAALGCAYATLVHPGVRLDPSVTIGEGTMIAAGCVLTVNITIGKHVVINVSSSISHDCEIADFVTISPGVHLSGATRVWRGAYLGTGSVTIQGLEIGEGAMIGAGAVVVRDIPPGVTAVGVPARPIHIM